MCGRHLGFERDCSSHTAFRGVLRHNAEGLFYAWFRKRGRGTPTGFNTNSFLAKRVLFNVA